MKIVYLHVYEPRLHSPFGIAESWVKQFGVKKQMGKSVLLWQEGLTNDWERVSICDKYSQGLHPIHISHD